MRLTITKTGFGRLVIGAAIAMTFAATAQAAAPGITGPTFNLSAAASYTTQPDGSSIYTWGYGCNGAPAGFAPDATAMPNANCPTMQIPGPTLIVTQGQTVTVNLVNNLPQAAGNTSMLFPGFDVTASGGTPGILTTEAATGQTVSYTFTATTPGTHAYYSGTQGDLQVEMGLFGAIIVKPGATPTVCDNTSNDAARSYSGNGSEADYRHAHAAFNHPSTCYDREYLFQLSETDPLIHRQVEEQVLTTPVCGNPTGCLKVNTETYHAVYFMVNGRSMPDDMEPNYAAHFPRQPYNGNPHMHPGEITLLRIIGQGRMQHPFHEHANHVRLIARDGNLLVNSDNKLSGPLLFTTTSTPGQAMDGLFQWTGKGLNWDVFGHAPTGAASTYNLDPSDPRFAAYNGKPVVCVPDANGYYTADSNAPNYYEWCADHNKPLESKPFGNVGSGGPVTLPDPNIVANGPWYSGTPYFGPDATSRAGGPTPIPPFGTIANDPAGEAGFAYMWHSHNEREITTNNIFPGGMMMMMLVDPRGYAIDESK